MSAALGIFDSGVGGLTVMQSIKQALPNEHLIYYGDTARVPYGNKSSTTIIRYSLENAKFLLKQNIKLLVVACNTSNAFAMPKLKELSDIPVVGVIEPGAEKAAAVTKNQHIAVLGTKATIQSGAYQQAIRALLPDAMVIALACPLLVPLVEERFFDHPATRLIVQEYLKPLKNQKIDTILLGCTHYPFVKNLIQEEMGPHVTLVDSAETCANKIAQTLKERNLEAKKQIPQYTYHASDDIEKFRQQAEGLFGHALTKVSLKK
jgi:glutamate racemase